MTAHPTRPDASFVTRYVRCPHCHTWVWTIPDRVLTCEPCRGTFRVTVDDDNWLTVAVEDPAPGHPTIIALPSSPDPAQTSNAREDAARVPGGEAVAEADSGHAARPGGEGNRGKPGHGSLGEAYGRLRKAIRLADALVAVNSVSGVAVSREEGRKRALRLAGLAGASEATWALVGDLILQRMAAMEKARRDR